MAITRVQGGFNSTGFAASLAVTLGAAVTSGSALCMMVVTSTGQPTMTDNGGGGSATYNLVSTTAAQGGLTGYTFYALNVTNGATVITATPAGGSGQIYMVVDEFSGVATSSALDGSSTNNQPTAGTGTDAVTSGSVTTSTNGCLIYGATQMGGTSLAAGTGYSNGSGLGGFTVVGSEWKVQSSSGSIAATFTIGATSATITGAFALKAPSSGTVRMGQLIIPQAVKRASYW